MTLLSLQLKETRSTETNAKYQGFLFRFQGLR